MLGREQGKQSWTVNRAWYGSIGTVDSVTW